MGCIRIRCVVPFCRRTAGQRKHWRPITADTQWLCGDHWRLVDKRLRRLVRKAQRHFHAVGTDRALKLDLWLWDRCKRQAIERGMGIAA